MDNYDDYCDLIDDNEETIETFKDIKEMNVVRYEDVHEKLYNDLMTNILILKKLTLK